MADGSFDPKPQSMVEEVFFVLDKTDKQNYPSDFDVLTTIDPSFGFE